MMSRSTVTTSACCVVLSLLGMGCDPVRTTMQHVHSQVVHSSSGKPALGASVQLKGPYDKASVSLKNVTEEQWLSFPPIHLGLTDKHGVAVVPIKITAVAHSLGWSTPRDRVTGFEYLCKVVRAEGADLLALEMRPGVSARGKHFGVSIKKIGQVRYVRTRE